MRHGDIFLATEANCCDLSAVSSTEGDARCIGTGLIVKIGACLCVSVQGTKEQGGYSLSVCLRACLSVCTYLQRTITCIIRVVCEEANITSLVARFVF